MESTTDTYAAFAAAAALLICISRRGVFVEGLTTGARPLRRHRFTLLWRQWVRCSAQICNLFYMMAAQFVSKIFKGKRQPLGCRTGMICFVCKVFELTRIKIDWTVELHVPIYGGEVLESCC